MTALLGFAKENNMNIKLIAMDLDGTLNNDEKRITEKTKAALMAIRNSCSRGRSLCNAFL